MTESHPPIERCLVLDLSSGIPGAYCTRLLADGGADVVKIESVDGDPLRRWSASGADIAPDDDGALFQHLSCSKRSVVLRPDDEGDRALFVELAQSADTIVWSAGSAVADHEAFAPVALRALAPHATVVAISPVGLEGPWAHQPHTEFTLQASTGAVAVRGTPDRPPLAVGGRTGEWIAGMFAAIGALIARRRQRQTGVGELVDVSMFESLILTHTPYPVTTAKILARTNRVVNFPDVEQTKDGMVGFTTGTVEQWRSFCTMIGREDWLEDPDLYLFSNRWLRFAELGPAVREWMRERTSAEIVEVADELRIPVAEVGNGANTPTFEGLRDRPWYVRNPRGGFLQPNTSYTLYGDAAPRSPAPAPSLGEHTEAVRAAPPRRDVVPVSGPTDRLPFAGLRVADFTSNWAGPFLTHQLAMFGADVIRVESVQRPDEMRQAVPRNEDQWWESPLFSALNTNKRAITLDLSDERGRALALRLCAQSDVVIDNYTPRVMERWGLDWDTLHSLKADLIQVRMPGFGLTGPWRDRTGWAMTAEQLSGLAWVTGYPDQVPQNLSGACDPINGGHGLVALLLALEHRDRTGEGLLVDAPLIGAALGISAEQVVEHSAYGNLLERQGNRGPTAAPQGVYLTADLLPDGRQDCWIALAVETDEQWRALRVALDDPEWARSTDLDTRAGRRAQHDLIDEHLTQWTQQRSADEIVDVLRAAGVPTAALVFSKDLIDNPQLIARGWWTVVPHPVRGQDIHNGYPVAFSSGPTALHRRHAPLLGEHNHDVLVGLLDVTEDEYARLEADQVIGTRPMAATVTAAADRRPR